MAKSTWKSAVVKYLKTTTLHGFKYLMSPYYSDQVGWVLGCVASACCAGGLCTVLWKRFLVLPALLALRDLPALTSDFQAVPTVAVCQPPFAIAHSFLHQLATNGDNVPRLAATFANAMQGKPTEAGALVRLQIMLTMNNLSLLQALHKYTPECRQIVKKCRWRNVQVPCQDMFEKEVTPWGVCCVANPDRFLEVKVPLLFRSESSIRLDMVLDCSNNSTFRGCEFFTKYVGEEWITPMHLSPGSNYLAELTFIFERDTDDEKLLAQSCVSDQRYSLRRCLLRCIELQCGCSDPLGSRDGDRNRLLQPCHIKRMSCLRSFGMKRKLHNSTCLCAPACKKVITKLIFESSKFKHTEVTLDPLFSELNSSRSTVIRVTINSEDSKLYTLIPTETWLTLLSSLGGVFNMFLGVGLFSALEFLFFLLVKLPIAMRQMPEKGFRSYAERNMRIYK